jgi:nucleoside-diphosphate-sugar epimerase
MNILILGSSGQIGSTLTNYLKPSHNVVEFDIEKDWYQDLRISGTLDEILVDIDFCFFLAFDVGGSRYLKKYQGTYEFLENNTAIMLNTFRSLRKFKTPFIFSSTQMSALSSFSSYGALKLLGEHYTKNMGGLLVKFWNIYGIENDPDKSHVITDFIDMALKNGVINMMTSGEESREFLYVEDCCSCLEILMNNYKIIPRDEELNITSFQETKIIDVARIIGDILDVPYTVGDDIDSVQLNSRNVADTTIYKYWKPTTKLEDGIKKIIEIMK